MESRDDVLRYLHTLLVNDNDVSTEVWDDVKECVTEALHNAYTAGEKHGRVAERVSVELAQWIDANRPPQN